MIRLTNDISKYCKYLQQPIFKLFQIQICTLPNAIIEYSLIVNTGTKFVEKPIDDDNDGIIIMEPTTINDE